MTEHTPCRTRRRVAGILAASAIASAGLAHSAQSKLAPYDLVTPVAEYKRYVSENAQQLVVDTRAFTDAVKAGDVAKAKALFAPSRTHYEAIEPIAELFRPLALAP